MKKKKLVIVSFSGGKDSLATMIWAIAKYGAKNIIAVFCDTKWEHPLTYKHIIDICKKLNVELVTLSSSKYDGFKDLVIKKKRFPSTKARFCTEKLKTEPMIDYILDDHKHHAIIIQGIRKDESFSRSKMQEQCRFFKYYFEPYQTNEMIVSTLSVKPKLTLSQKVKLKKAEDRLAAGKNDEKFHSYRKKDVIAHCKQYSDDIHRPIFHLTAHETLQMILDAGLKPNPLYYMGMSRVGCFPCINVNHKELWAIIENQSWILDDLRDFEKETGHSFFPPKYIPDRYCSLSVENKKGIIVPYPIVDDVVRYLRDVHATGDIFEGIEKDENSSCMSFYGICE